MPAQNPIEITFPSGSNLEVRVLMTGPHHRFRTGKIGYLWRDQFDWNGKRWRLRFQAFVTHSLVFDGMTGLPLQRPVSGTTHGMLEEVRGDVVSSARIVVQEPAKESRGEPSPLTHMEKLIEAAREAQDWLEAGWKLTKFPNEIQGTFDLSRLKTKPSGKMYSFASCNIETEGVLYLCQFHLREQLEPLPKPTAWDWSRGARAGIPTLGKRR